jgi:hypothetical protein
LNEKHLCMHTYVNTYIIWIHQIFLIFGFDKIYTCMYVVIHKHAHIYVIREQISQAFNIEMFFAFVN